MGKYFNCQNAPQLENTLKLLVIQSCRGTLEQPSYDGIDSSATGEKRNLDGYFKNTIIALKTFQNNQAVRFPKDGTPYTQKFCEAFKQGQSLSLMDFFHGYC